MPRWFSLFVDTTFAQHFGRHLSALSGQSSGLSGFVYLDDNDDGGERLTLDQHLSVRDQQLAPAASVVARRDRLGLPTKLFRSYWTASRAATRDARL